MESICFIGDFCGLKSALVSWMPVFRRKITTSEITTLTSCERVVPSAAPAGPRRMAPINRKSSPILAAQATAMKYIGLLESPSPRKIDAMIL